MEKSIRELRFRNPTFLSPPKPTGPIARDHVIDPITDTSWQRKKACHGLPRDAETASDPERSVATSVRNFSLDQHHSLDRREINAVLMTELLAKLRLKRRKHKSHMPVALDDESHRSSTEVADAIKLAESINGPVLVEFIVEQHDMVYPMVATGADLNDMISRPVHDQFQESEM